MSDGSRSRNLGGHSPRSYARNVGRVRIHTQRPSMERATCRRGTLRCLHARNVVLSATLPPCWFSPGLRAHRSDRRRPRVPQPGFAELDTQDDRISLRDNRRTSHAQRAPGVRGGSSSTSARMAEKLAAAVAVQRSRPAFGGFRSRGRRGCGRCRGRRRRSFLGGLISRSSTADEQPAWRQPGRAVRASWPNSRSAHAGQYGATVSTVPHKMQDVETVAPYCPACAEREFGLP